MSAPAEKRAEILAIIQPFRATVVDVAPSSITIQMTGNAEKSEALCQSFDHTCIRRSNGATGFPRLNTKSPSNHAAAYSGLHLEIQFAL